jgi:two-component system phosphate regulon sensor histidine kinase PhoR
MLIFDLRWLLFALIILFISSVMIAVALTRWFEQRRLHATFLPMLQALLEDAPIGVLLLADSQAYQYANALARWLLGLTTAHGSLSNAPWVAALTEDIASTQREPQTPHRYRTLALARESTTDEASVRWQVTRLADFAVVFITDVTSQQRAEQQTRLLLSDLSHELRTPLATLLTHLEVLRLPILSDEVRGQSLHFMKGETQRLVRLVNNALELGRLEMGLAQEVALVNVLKVVEEAVAQVTPKTQAAGASIAIEAALPLPSIFGQPERLKQIFLNLLENAIQYGTVGNCITVKLQNRPDGLQCAVCDTGPGIASEHLPHLTRRFYRAAPAGIVGNGLGLALVAEILRQHQSALKIESVTANMAVTGEQRGTCMSFTLPAPRQGEGA